MSRRAYSLIAVLALVVALAAAFVVYTRQPTASLAKAGAAQTGVLGRGGSSAAPGQGAVSPLASLGITGKPSSTTPKGLQVTGFTSSSASSALKSIGVKEGDVIVSCNGQGQQIGQRCVAATEGLEKRGEPMTLVVIRNSKQVTLESTKKLPGAETGQKPR